MKIDRKQLEAAFAEEEKKDINLDYEADLVVSEVVTRKKSFYNHGTRHNYYRRDIINDSQMIMGNKNKKNCFYDILDTIFWRYSVTKSKSTFSSFAQYNNPNGYRELNMAGFHDNFSNNVIEPTKVRKLFRKTNRDLLDFGVKSGDKKTHKFVQDTLPLAYGSVKEDVEMKQDRFTIGYNLMGLNVKQAELQFENALLKHPKKYILLKTVPGSYKYDFNSDISNRLLSDDYIKPYFAITELYKRNEFMFYDQPMTTFGLGGWGKWDEREQFLASSKRQFISPDVANEYFPVGTRNLKQDHSLNAYIFEHLDNTYLNKLGSFHLFFDPENIRRTVLKTTYKKENGLNLVTQHFLNNFFLIGKKNKFSWDEEDPNISSKHLRPRKALFDDALSYFLTNGNQQDFNDIFYKNRTDFFSKDPMKWIDTREAPETLMMQEIPRLNYSNTPLGLNLEWTNFWFPGNIYNPFHDYDFTAYALQARKLYKRQWYVMDESYLEEKKVLNFWNAGNSDVSTELLVFLDPQFARGDINKSLISPLGFQLVTFFTLTISAMLYLFILSRLQIVLFWLIGYLSEADFYYFRRLFNINFHSIIQYCLKRILKLTFYLLVVSFLILLWKSVFFISISLPYRWRLFMKEFLFSRFKENAPLQMPTRILKHVQRSRPGKYARWRRHQLRKKMLTKSRSRKQFQIKQRKKTHVKRKTLLGSPVFKIQRHRFHSEEENLWEGRTFNNAGVPAIITDTRFSMRKFKRHFAPFNYQGRNFRPLRYRAKLRRRYINRKLSRKTRFLMADLNKTKMYFVSPIDHIFYQHYLHDRNTIRRIRSYDKVFVRKRRVLVRSANSAYSAFRRIEKLQGIYRAKPKHPGASIHKRGRRAQRMKKRRKGRPFSSAHLFQSETTVPLKAYWGGGHYYHPFVILRTLYNFVDAHIRQIRYKFRPLLTYPFEPYLSPGTFWQFNKGNHKWIFNLFMRPPDEDWFVRYRFPFNADRINILRFSWLKGIFTYKRDIKTHPEFQQYVRFVKRYWYRKARFYFYYRPSYFLFSGIPYFFNLGVSYIFVIFKLLFEEMYKLILIMCATIFVYIKNPNIQPLPTLKAYTKHRQFGWFFFQYRIDFFKQFKVKIKRRHRIKKFIPEFWSAAPRRTWSSSSRRRT